MSSNRPFIRLFIPILFIFIFVSSLAIIFRARMEARNIDQSLVLGGNLLLFAVTATSLMLYRKALLAENTQAFLRNVYSGMLLKLFVCLTAAFIYIYAAGTAVNKTGLFILMFLYLLYTFTEVALVLKQSRQIKQRKNA